MFVFRGCESIVTQVTHGVVGDNARKVVQFATMLHLLQQGLPMLEYEALKPLFKFLQVQKTNNKHWSDNFGWTMAEFMHQEVLRVTRAIVGITHYVVLSSDEVFIVDNQSWLFMHYYVMQNWVKIPILIYLDWVIEGSRSDNLTKVIMEALMIGGGVLKDQIAQK